MDSDSNVWIRGDYEIVEMVHEHRRISLTVQPAAGAMGSRFTLYGDPAVLAQLICDLDKHRNRAVAQLADEERNGQYAEDLRVLSGEHPVVPEEGQ